MEHPAFLWAAAGLVLAIVELMTGTFYLLMLGVAAFGAALAALLGLEFGAQAIVAVVVSAVGCYAVHVYKARNSKEQMAPIDAGMPGIVCTIVSVIGANGAAMPGAIAGRCEPGGTDGAF